MQLTKKEHVGWIDVLRITACFSVVFSHCCDPFVASFDTDRLSFLTGVFSGSLVRCSVPLFVMMTGVLLLPMQTDMFSFYKKRIGRILIPLIFWSVALPFLYYIYFRFFSTGSPCITIENFTAGVTLNKLYTFIFNFTYDTTPLWYLYMLVGLYFIMPILSAWMQQAARRELKIFLWIWGATLFLPYFKMAAPMLGYRGNYGNMGLFGVCDWNEYGTFYYVSGFIGYLVLAHYLNKYPVRWSKMKMSLILIPMFVAGYLMTSFGYLLFQKWFPGNYAYLEIVWLFAGINVFMMTFPVFVFIRNLRISSRHWLSRLAGATFGIYLCHFVFVQLFYDMFDFLQPPYLLHIVGMALLTFAVSYLVVRVLWRFRVTRLLVK